MRTNKYHYERQEEFYYDFEFLPIQNLKKHNGFVYKIYAPTNDEIHQVFDHPFNQEVMERNYAISVLWGVKTVALPAITQSIGKFSGTLKLLKKLLRITDENTSFLKRLIDPIQESQALLILYKKNHLKMIATELQQLLSNKTYAQQYLQVNSLLLSEVQKTMECMGTVLVNKFDLLSNLMTDQLQTAHQPVAMAQVPEEIHCSIQLMKNFEQVNASLIKTICNWKNNRMIHEQQEILN